MILPLMTQKLAIHSAVPVTLGFKIQFYDILKCTVTVYVHVCMYVYMHVQKNRYYLYMVCILAISMTVSES